MAANMWKNSSKNVESDNNKVLYETLVDFFLQWNGSYLLNKSRTSLLLVSEDPVSIAHASRSLNIWELTW